MTTKDNKRVPNDFVEQLLEVIDEAGRFVIEYRLLAAGSRNSLRELCHIVNGL